MNNDIIYGLYEFSTRTFELHYRLSDQDLGYGEPDGEYYFRVPGVGITVDSWSTIDDAEEALTENIELM